jgi:hypothetical protein
MPMQAQSGGGGIVQSIPNLGARSRWVVSTTPRTNCHRERYSTQCTGKLVAPRAGPESTENLPLTGIRSSDLPTCNESEMDFYK